jgi:hypothetical protein
MNNQPVEDTKNLVFSPALFIKAFPVLSTLSIPDSHKMFKNENKRHLFLQPRINWRTNYQLFAGKIFPCSHTRYVKVLETFCSLISEKVDFSIFLRSGSSREELI